MYAIKKNITVFCGITVNKFFYLEIDVILRYY